MEHFTVPGAVDAPELARTVIEWAVRRLIETKLARFGPVPRGIEKYVDAINQSIATANWFGALFLALAMPDICGALEDPTEQVGVRYKRWFDRYMARRYAPELFSAADCFYLRCAALHQGLASHPQAQNARVVFITPPPGGSIFHSNFAQVADGSFVLQLQIDVFCAEICEGVMQWSNDVAGDQATQARIAELLEFYDPTTPLNLAP